MSTTRLFQGVLVLGLAALVAGSGLAAERAPAANESSLSDANAVPPPAAGTASPQSMDLVRASRVLHAKVESTDGRELGRVHDLVLTPDLKAVSYVAVARGGFLGIGSSLYAIPWTSMRQSTDRTFAVPITEQELTQSRGFRNADWPSSATLQGAVYPTETRMENRSVQERRFTHLRGIEAKESQGRNVGDVKDMAIVMDTGQIAYTILSYDGFFGLGTRYAAVPENALTLEPAARIARVDATKETILANAFPPGRWPDLASPAYDQQLAAAYGVAPAGTALAYVPPEGTTAVARAPRTTAPSARSTTPPASATTPTPLGEPTTAELTGTFNPSNITTISGTVVAEGRFQPPSGTEMIWLRVRPETGQPILVNLGPRSYISTQDFYVVPGDRIRLTGSQVTSGVSGRQVFLPMEASYDSHTLRLRSRTGTPLWEGQGATPAGQKPAASEPSKAGAAATPPLGYTPAEGRETAPGRSAATSPSATMVEPTPDELTGTFNPTNITTMNGTVIDEGKFTAPSGQDMLWLRVRTTDGRTILVNLGPRSYVSGQDFYVVRGDRIHLTGSEVTAKASGKRVFLPTEATYNNRVLRLRSKTGTPLWEGQMGTAATPPLGYTPPGAQGSAEASERAGQPRAGTTGQPPAGQAPGLPTPSQQATPPGAAGTSRSARTPGTEPNEPNEP